MVSTHPAGYSGLHCGQMDTLRLRLACNGSAMWMSSCSFNLPWLSGHSIYLKILLSFIPADFVGFCGDFRAMQKRRKLESCSLLAVSTKHSKGQGMWCENKVWEDKIYCWPRLQSIDPGVALGRIKSTTVQETFQYIGQYHQLFCPTSNVTHLHNTMHQRAALLHKSKTL